MKSLDVGDPCPKCKRPLRISGMSGAYLACSHDHVTRRLTRCTECRRRARQFINGTPYCADHGDERWYLGNR